MGWDGMGWDGDGMGLLTSLVLSYLPNVGWEHPLPVENCVDKIIKITHSNLDSHYIHCIHNYIC